MAQRPKLAVILGAGASHDVCPDAGPIKSPEWRPPLVNTMFQGGTFDIVLENHPEAQALMSSLRTRVRAGDSFEETLRRYLDDSAPYIQRQMAFVPIALHEFFYRVSTNFTTEAINYSHLVNCTVGQGVHTAFVTVNYDTLLEMSLGKITGIYQGTLDSYVSSPDWLLVKLHGSVGWGYPWRSTQRTTSLRIAAQSNELPRRDAAHIRVGLPPGQMYSEDTLFYPALSLPVAGKYGFVCPPSHVEALERFMADCHNFLFVGFSANDQDLLDFLNKTVKQVERLAVVTSQRDLVAVTNRLFEAVPELMRGGSDADNNVPTLGFTWYLENRIDPFVASLSA